MPGSKGQPVWTGRSLFRSRLSGHPERRLWRGLDGTRTSWQNRDWRETPSPMIFRPISTNRPLLSKDGWNCAGHKVRRFDTVKWPDDKSYIWVSKFISPNFSYTMLSLKSLKLTHHLTGFSVSKGWRFLAGLSAISIACPRGLQLQSAFKESHSKTDLYGGGKRAEWDCGMACGVTFGMT